jgi:hypothetical protein
VRGADPQRFAGAALAHRAVPEQAGDGQDDGAGQAESHCCEYVLPPSVVGAGLEIDMSFSRCQYFYVE